MPQQTEGVQAFLQKIQTLYSAEKMLTEALPKMMEKAQNFGLKKSIALHLAETDQHKEALRLICKSFGVDAEGITDNDMKTIIEKGEQGLLNLSGIAADEAIIASAKQVEEYEIAQYDIVSQAALSLGYEGIALRLRLTQEEERQTLTKLNFLAKEPIDKGVVVLDI